MKIFQNNRFFHNKIWIRRIMQVFFFSLIALISINNTLVASGNGIPFLSSASLHALCPFGGVVTIYQFLTTGTFVQKIHESAFILMIIGFLMAVLFGPVFCGWVCPLGTVQEWFAALGRKIFKKKALQPFYSNFGGCHTAIYPLFCTCLGYLYDRCEWNTAIFKY